MGLAFNRWTAQLTVPTGCETGRTVCKVTTRAKRYIPNYRVRVLETRFGL